MKDLLIGATDNYSWNTLAPWARSIRESGFEGDIALLLYRTNDKPLLVQKCKELKIDIFECSTDSNVKPIIHMKRDRDTQVHQMRFFHAWQLLESYKNNPYRFVIMTDTKDVIFQRNPSGYINSYFEDKPFIIAPSEGIKYKDEYWGKENLLAGYGPYVYKALENSIIRNVGTIGGSHRAFSDLCLLIYTMGENRYIPNDQSSFNVIVNMELCSYAHVVDGWMRWGWACQCGTTLDPTKNYSSFIEKQEIPIIKNGRVISSLGDEFYLIHQYDRVPELDKLIKARYAE